MMRVIHQFGFHIYTICVIFFYFFSGRVLYHAQNILNCYAKRTDFVETILT